MAGLDALLHDASLVYLGLFLAALVDATGFPFPGRALLVTAGAIMARDWGQVALMTAAGALGAAVGDHLWYAAGRLGAADRLTRLYCKLSLASGRCEARARSRFDRFGPLAIVIGRFVAECASSRRRWPAAARSPTRAFSSFDLLGAIAGLASSSPGLRGGRAGARADGAARLGRAHRVRGADRGRPRVIILVRLAAAGATARRACLQDDHQPVVGALLGHRAGARQHLPAHVVEDQPPRADRPACATMSG